MSLAVRSLVVDLDGRRIIDGVSLHVDTGRTLAVCGPSGSGKTTLLRAIAGLVPVRSGAVEVDGADITSTPTHRRSIGLVFQDNQLFPHMNVARNIGYGLRVLGWDAGRIGQRVDELLERVQLGDRRDQDVATLSGGEAKRVALARALAPSPRVLLLDEPFTGLDRSLHDQLAVMVDRVLRDSGTTALLVSHDPADVAAIAQSRIDMPPALEPPSR
ncbi:MAG: ABC transporter [Acidimicrobiales bacterium mtb01]|nr:ATP-binding cassette domain-containing protein [Actinomycetota bacterium]TEX47868.1 MAG: ABC transporter [Acidimicrobiales bacterium mtb01]